MQGPARLLDMSSEEPESWDRGTTSRIGQQIKRIRGRRISAQSLSDRTAQLGYPIGRATISELETGRRKTITVPELLVLAAALDTSPALLVYGDQLADGPVNALPELTDTAANALMWFSGLKAIIPESVEQYDNSNEPVTLVHSRHSIEVSLQYFDKQDENMMRLHARQFADVQQRMKSEGMIVGGDHGDD